MRPVVVVLVRQTSPHHHTGISTFGNEGIGPVCHHGEPDFSVLEVGSCTTNNPPRRSNSPPNDKETIVAAEGEEPLRLKGYPISMISPILSVMCRSQLVHRIVHEHDFLRAVRPKRRNGLG